MEARDILNYRKLSLLFTDNDNQIRKNHIPKKHQEKIKELEQIIDYWISKNKQA